jgi:RNA polymerase sigma-70 factor, ECF subfamily
MASTTLTRSFAVDAPTEIDVAALFVEHAPFLLRVVERLTGRGPHVEDIVQEVFVVAHRKRKKLVPGPSMRGWLYRTARNMAEHHRRGLGRFFRLKDAVKVEPQQAPPAADDVARRREEGRKIRSCALTLPFSLREVFVLHELEGMETATVAALLDVPEGTVWSRLSTALAAFRAQWEGSK